MNGDTANLSIILSLRDQASAGIRKVDGGFASLTKRTAKLRGELGKVRQGLATGIKVGAAVAAGGIAFLALQVRAGIESLGELEDVTNQTNAAIKSTKGVANVSEKAIRSLSERYEELTTVDDKVIQRGANVLLTFTNIRRKAFEPTTAAALDMATALNMDTTAAFKMLGKALNDPAQGLSKLTRLGVTFTDGEKKKITTLVESGNRLEAQRLILGKLNRMYGGSAEAAANGYRGQMRRLDDAVEGLQQSLARALMPALTNVARRMSTFLKAPQVEAQVSRIGAALAGLFTDSFTTSMETDPDSGQSAVVVKKMASPFTTGLGLVKEAFQGIKDLPWDTIRGSLAVTMEVGRQALSIYQSLPKEVQVGLVTLLAANKVTGGALGALGRIAVDLALKAVTTIMAGNVTVVGATVTGPGGPGLPVPVDPKVPGGGGNLLTNLAKLIPWVAISMAMPREEHGVTLEQLHAEREQGRLLGAGNAITDRIKEAQQAALVKIADHVGISGTGNDLLRGLEEEGRLAWVESRKGNEILLGTGAEQKEALGRLRDSTSRDARITHAKAELARNASLRAIPVLGAVRSAVNAVQQAVNRKDLSVTVRTSLSVSAREIASEVQRVTNNSGRVYS